MAPAERVTTVDLITPACREAVTVTLEAGRDCFPMRSPCNVWAYRERSPPRQASEKLSWAVLDGSR